MERDRIEAEVRRLAPWRCRFELGGVATDIATSNEPLGPRSVRLPNVARAAVVGRTVLDAGCGEGGHAFAALDYGALHVTGFDAALSNVEKARFVASVRGDENVEFLVASSGEWLSRSSDKFDYVFLSELLGRLPDPHTAMRGLSGLARRGLFVTSALAGGAHGFTHDGQAVTPNTTQTILHELAPHGFLPLYIAEQRTRDPSGPWGECRVLFKRSELLRPDETEPNDLVPRANPVLDMHLVPDDDASTRGEAVASLCLYNWGAEPLEIETEVRAGGDANALGDPQASTWELGPRVADEDGSSSESTLIPLRFEAPQDSTLAVLATVRDRRSGRLLARRSARISLPSQS